MRQLQFCIFWRACGGGGQRTCHARKQRAKAKRMTSSARESLRRLVSALGAPAFGEFIAQLRRAASFDRHLCAPCLRTSRAPLCFVRRTRSCCYYSARDSLHRFRAGEPGNGSSEIPILQVAVETADLECRALRCSSQLDWAHQRTVTAVQGVSSAGSAAAAVRTALP